MSYNMSIWNVLFQTDIHVFDTLIDIDRYLITTDYHINLMIEKRNTFDVRRS